MVGESSFLHEILGHLLLQGLPSMVSLSDGGPLGMLVSLGFGSDQGPGTAGVVFILDGDEAATTALDVVLVLKDGSTVVPLEALTRWKLGVLEGDQHVLSIDQFLLGLPGLGDLVGDLVPRQVLLLPKWNLNVVVQAGMADLHTDLVLGSKVGEQLVQDVSPDLGGHVIEVFHLGGVLESDGHGVPSREVALVQLLRMRGDLIEISKVQLGVFLDWGLATGLTKVFFQHPGFFIIISCILPIWMVELGSPEARRSELVMEVQGWIQFQVAMQDGFVDVLTSFPDLRQGEEVQGLQIFRTGNEVEQSHCRHRERDTTALGENKIDNEVKKNFQPFYTFLGYRNPTPKKGKKWHKNSLF